MKRLVCILLALLMVASLMPAGFAATSGRDSAAPGVVNPPSQGGSSSVHTHGWQFLKTVE